MGASFKVDTRALRELSEKIDNPALINRLYQLTQDKDIIALVAQAISDNFRQEGPGWAPLKAATIRASVAKRLKKRLQGLSDEDLLKYEALARNKTLQRSLSPENRSKPHRKILDKSGVLRSSVTVPGAQHNIYYTEGTNIVWGTNLPYAGVHNNGNPAKGIPQREYLVIREKWEKQLYTYVMERIMDIINSEFGISGRKAIT